MKKLTLSIEDRDIESARRLARRSGTSISNMFSRLIRAMARRSGSTERTLPPHTRKALGALKLPRGKSDRDLLESALLHRNDLSK